MDILLLCKMVNQERDGVIIIYVVAIILFAILLYYIVLKQYVSLGILFVGLGAIVVLTLNLVLSSSNIHQDYDKELEIYSYVEKNASTIAIVSIAIVLLITNYDKQSRDFERVATFTKIILSSFIFAILILVIVWIPIGNAVMLRYLRDIKTCLLTYSLSFLIMGMLFFMSEGIHTK